MSEIILYPDSEILFQVEINACFGGKFTKLHLIPSESENTYSFFQVNQNGHNSFVVKVSQAKAKKLLSHLLSNVLAEEIMPQGRHSTTSIEGKVSWKNISYPKIERSGKISLSERSYVTPKEFQKASSTMKLPDEKLQEIKACIDKKMFSPVIAVSETLEKLSESEEEFMKFIEKL